MNNDEGSPKPPELQEEKRKPLSITHRATNKRLNRALLKATSDNTNDLETIYGQVGQQFEQREKENRILVNKSMPNLQQTHDIGSLKNRIPFRKRKIRIKKLSSSGDSENCSEKQENLGSVASQSNDNTVDDSKENIEPITDKKRRSFKKRKRVCKGLSSSSDGENYNGTNNTNDNSANETLVNVSNPFTLDNNSDETENNAKGNGEIVNRVNTSNNSGEEYQRENNRGIEIKRKRKRDDDDDDDDDEEEDEEREEEIRYRLDVEGDDRGNDRNHEQDVPNNDNSNGEGENDSDDIGSNDGEHDSDDDTSDDEERDDSDSDNFNDDDDDDDDPDGDDPADEDDSESGSDGNEEVPSTFFGLAKICNLPGLLQLRNNVSQLYIILGVLALAVRGQLTYVVTIMILRFINKIIVNCRLPRHKSRLWSLLSRNDLSAMTRHYFCRECKDYLGINKVPHRHCSCTKCGPDRTNVALSYFVHLKITPQLKQFLSNPNLVQNLQYRFTRQKKNEGAIEDVYDGATYKEKCQEGGFLSYRYNYSFVIFTDGVQVSLSSKESAWPVFLKINELSPQARKRYMILAAIIVDKGHPNLNSLLLPVIEELDQLYRTGITWTNPINGLETTSKFITLICTADSMARAPLLNMMLLNAQFGCTFCKTETIYIRNSRKFSVLTEDQQRAIRRDDASMRQDMQHADERNETLNGIKGYSVLMGLNEFDLAKGPIVDNMHCVYMGVTKHLTDLMLSSKYANAVWYHGRPNEISAMNRRLLAIRPPSVISRTPRPIGDMRQWKASEWRNWLYFEGPIAMEGTIRDEDLRHFGKLSTAGFILNKDSISIDELEEARTLLNDFVASQFNKFGLFHIRYNVHLLTHLAETVRNWGPCWAYNAFDFESWNKKIIDKVTAGNSRPLQIATRFFMAQFVESFLHDPDADEEMKDMINSILTDDSRKEKYITNYEVVPEKVIGKGDPEIRPPSDGEMNALRAGGYEPENIVFYNHAIMRGIDYRSRQKDLESQTKFCNAFVYYGNKDYGEILKIVTFTHDEHIKWGLIIQQLRNIGEALHTRHIHIVERTDVELFVDIDYEVPIPAIVLYRSENQLCITRVCNINETD